METKLLPCPFCPDGGEPKISRYSYELEYGAHVYCRRCNTSGPEIHESMPLEDVEVLAIEAWNTRWERTTRIMQGSEGTPFGENIVIPLVCEVCGHGISVRDSYCRTCGARIEEDTDA